MYYDYKFKRYNFLIAKKNNRINSCLGILKSNKSLLWLSIWFSDLKKEVRIRFAILSFKNYKKRILAANGINIKTIPIYKSLGFKVVYLNHFFIINPYIKNIN